MITVQDIIDAGIELYEARIKVVNEYGMLLVTDVWYSNTVKKYWDLPIKYIYSEKPDFVLDKLVTFELVKNNNLNRHN